MEFVHIDHVKPVVKDWIKEQPYPKYNCLQYLSEKTGISIRGIIRILEEYDHVEYFKADRLLTTCEKPAALLGVQTVSEDDLGKIYSPIRREEWKARKRKQRAKQKATI